MGTDNFAGGKIAGKFVKYNFSKNGANVAILGGIPGIVAGDQRLTGFKAGLEGSPNIKS
ncbi:hypothetical protein GC093_21380 [Paenibacillus sp. LMG 31456]|uniref:Uncharacterized protein n=1 Tax=Paenibacillus foliorum TaxID=2654974 RepID=A0A972GRY0_9BACL|nr:hypothetical protein [Paenibacillus foliorum]